jgi:hypothetical protein
LIHFTTDWSSDPDRAGTEAPSRATQPAYLVDGVITHIEIFAKQQVRTSDERQMDLYDRLVVLEVVFLLALALTSAPRPLRPLSTS